MRQADSAITLSQDLPVRNRFYRAEEGIGEWEGQISPVTGRT